MGLRGQFGTSILAWRMNQPFRHISVRDDREITIITIELARLSSYELSEALGRELIAAVKGRESPQVAVDLSKIEYMSSVGYAPPITLRARVRDLGGRIILCGLRPVVKEMFDATRLLITPQSPKSLLEFTDSFDDALAALRA